MVGLGLMAGLSGGGRAIMSEVSPDKTYRIDWVSADRLDRALHADMSTPARIELYDNISGWLIGTSEVIDVDLGGNGRVLWLMKDMGMVSAGPGAQFLHVQPLAPDGHKLPIEKEFSGKTTASGGR